MLIIVSLGFHDLDKYDCDLLGICNGKKKEVSSHILRRGYVSSKVHSTVLPYVRKIRN